MTYLLHRMISDAGNNVHDICDFSQTGTGSMKTVIHISESGTSLSSHFTPPAGKLDRQHSAPANHLGK